MLPPHISLSLYFTPAAVNRHAHSRVPHKNVRWHCGKAPYHIKVSGRARDVADLDQIDLPKPRRGHKHAQRQQHRAPNGHRRERDDEIALLCKISFAARIRVQPVKP